LDSGVNSGASKVRAKKGPGNGFRAAGKAAARGQPAGMRNMELSGRRLPMRPFATMAALLFLPLFSVAVPPAGPVTASGDPPAGAKPLECDVLAGEQDYGIPVPGVEFGSIDASRAVAACRADLERFPDNPRLIHNLARAFDKSGQMEEAVALYRKAADMGFAWSRNNLSVKYLLGEGVAPDMRKAMYWMRLAYRQGNRLARANYTDTDMAPLFGSSAERIGAMQKALAEAGAYSGAITGRFSQETNAAIDSYKARHGIKGEGITFEFLDALGITETVLEPKPARSGSAGQDKPAVAGRATPNR
jgi:TPR repeat protein